MPYLPLAGRGLSEPLIIIIYMIGIKIRSARPSRFFLGGGRGAAGPAIRAGGEVFQLRRDLVRKLGWMTPSLLSR